MSRHTPLAATAAAAGALLALTALLLARPGHDEAGAPPTAPLTVPRTPATPEHAPDNTGRAGADAERALETWRGSNPAGNGAHSVGGDATTGAGGRVTEVLRIPALGNDWAQPVYEGVSEQQLRSGIGHFPTTEQPGQVGNFALAGHRSGVTDPPLRDIDRVTPGASITVTTANRITYTYTVTRVRRVTPTNVDVIAQVPGHPKTTPTTAKLTLVTCWPADGHAKRVVVEADLVSAKGGA